MDRKNLERSLMRYANGSMMISARKVREHMCIGQASAHELLEGLEYIENGKKVRRYYIPDVAQRIMERAHR